MKNIINKYLFSLLFALCLLIPALGTAQAASAASGQVGYADFIYLINQHPETAAANAALKAEQETLKQEFDSKAASLSDKEKLELSQQLALRLEQKRVELIRPISSKVVSAANEVAKENGLLIVISNKDVITGGVDVTPAILAKITGK